MAAVTAKTIRNFLDRYGNARAKQTAEGVQRLDGDLARIRPDLEAAKRRRAEHTRLVAPNFNMFSILRVKNLEATHSNFLRELLDPQGTHGQGMVFFTSFLALCERAGAISPGAENMESRAGEISVSREETIIQDRCDLLIHAPGLCLLIENKIKAPEGDKQLVRYRKWLDDFEKLSHNIRTMLVFLTRDGRRSADPKIPDEKYIRLSYVDDIRNWLTECMCMEHIQAPGVRSIVDQYLGVINEWKEKQDAGTDT